MDKYILPDFKNLGPRNIKHFNKEIKKSKLYNSEIDIKPPKNTYFKSLMKLIEDYNLTRKDYKILLFYLNDIENRNLFNKLFSRFSNQIDEFKSTRMFIRPIIYYIYNYHDSSDNTLLVYKLLQECSKKLGNSEKYNFIKLTIDLSWDMKTYLESIKKQFYNCESEEDIENFMKESFMKNTDKFYSECMVKYIIKNHKKSYLEEQFFKCVDLMDLDLKKEVFSGILQEYINEGDINNYPSKWFENILYHLGEPYSLSNTKWNGIREELKEVFRRWNNKTQLYDFFTNITGFVDRARLNFWEEYIGNIYRIKYYEHLESALVMEFKNHIFIEFAKYNNACYVYNRSIKSIDEIDMNSQKYKKAKELKEPLLAEAKLIHSGYWQYKFESTIRYLGYKKSRW